jgi:kinesin family protein C1
LNQSVESASGNLTTKAYPFQFDKVFQPQTSQAQVFEEISQLVQSALDGYNVCIFAYGQTGSGKTFTMEGPEIESMTEETMGMIPRAVNQIYASAERLKPKGWEFQIEGQYLEIYNETLRDLIGTYDPNKKHEIKHTGYGGKTTVMDITTGNEFSQTFISSNLTFHGISSIHFAGSSSKGFAESFREPSSRQYTMQ